MSMPERTQHPVPVKAEPASESSTQPSGFGKQPKWLTDPLACSVHRVRGTVKRIAFALGVRDADVYAAADINGPKPLKAHWIPAIVRETGSYAVLEAIAKQCGCAVIKLPAASVTHAELVEDAGNAVKEFGDAVTAVGEALADGRIDASEAARVTQEADEAIRAILTLEAAVRNRVAA